MATEFTIFSQLIVELRLEIWRLALPAPVKKPLYAYRKGCWTSKYLKEGDQGFEQAEDNLYMEFNTSRLEPLYIKMPLCSVNREARGIAEEYVQKQNMPTRQVDGQSTEIIRPFDPSTDIVFLSSTNVDDFLREPLERLSEPDLLNRNVSCSNPALTRLAISPSGLEDLKRGLGDFFSTAGFIETLYVVDEAYTYTSQISEVGDAPRARFTWTNSRRKWEAVGDDDAALAQMKELVAGLEDELTSFGGYDLEVQLVDLVSS